MPCMKSRKLPVDLDFVGLATIINHPGPTIVGNAASVLYEWTIIVPG